MRKLLSILLIAVVVSFALNVQAKASSLFGSSIVVSEDDPNDPNDGGGGGNE
jgi:hypothetical protein